MKYAFIYIVLYLSFAQYSMAQTDVDLESDAQYIKTLYEKALTEQESFAVLSQLTTIGPRMSGTQNYADAVELCKKLLGDLPFDDISEIPATVNIWQRGNNDAVEIVRLSDSTIYYPLRSLSLGNTTGTGNKWIQGEVVVFNHLDSVRALSIGALDGKIAYFNKPFNQALLSPFRAYGSAVAQRVFGPEEASKKGAIATIVRSMTGRTDKIPHTGTTQFTETTKNIPAFAISTVDAIFLDEALDQHQVQLKLRSDSKLGGTTIDMTVVAEIKGHTFPDEIILVGGHLDSWDMGQGAHDDGAGIAHSISAFKLLLESGYKPKRTWRCVLFANEENGLAGAKAYAKKSNENNEFHLAAIESDAGGNRPLSFSFVADGQKLSTYMQKVKNWWPVLEPYSLQIEFAGSGADINPLKNQGGLLIGLRPEPNRYFDYHHSANDVLANVHPRELSMGSAAIASLVYFIDKYGLDAN